MSKIQLLDCTLRDGGYINNWHFGKDVISGICRSLSTSKLDIIEVGFLTDMPHGEDESLYSDCDEIKEKCFCNDISTFAAMIAIGEKEMNPISMPCAENSSIDIVRITFHQDSSEIEKAVMYARCLMDKGYKVCMQPVGTTSYTDKELLELIDRINLLKPYAFYLVDTLGLLCREELLRFIYLMDYNLNDGIKIGFHSHNNLQMSFANAQFIIDYHSKREFIVDCSVYGMGRGAGNLCTELIAQYTNNIGLSSYNMVSIYETLDNYIYPIFLTASWGYSAHYYISAVHKCHPNYAAYLMNKQTLTMNQIDLVLKNIPSEKRDIFDKKLIEKMYYNFQNKPVDDHSSLDLLKKRFGKKNILILAPGQSICKYSDKIHDFIFANEPIVISINGIFEGYKSDLIFISNSKRLYGIDPDSIKAEFIITSNLPNVILNSYYVYYSSLCDQAYNESDNSGLMLLRLLRNIGIKKVYIAGFDGFDEIVRNNYYADKLINSVNSENVDAKNQSISEQFRQLKAEIQFETLTPSKYF